MRRLMWRTCRLPVLVVVLGMTLGAARSGYPQDPKDTDEHDRASKSAVEARLRLLSSGCARRLIRETARLLRIELGVRVAVEERPADGNSGQHEFEATLLCQGEAVAITLAAPNVEVLGRRLNLSEQEPIGQPRLLALTLAEVVLAALRSSRNAPQSATASSRPESTEPEPTGSEAPASTRDERVSRTTSAPDERPRHQVPRTGSPTPQKKSPRPSFGLAGSAGIHYWERMGQLGPTVSLGGVFRIPPWIALGDVRLAWASAEHALGEIRLQDYGIGVAAGPTLSVNTVGLAPVVGVRWSWTRLAGEARDSTVQASTHEDWSWSLLTGLDASWRGLSWLWTGIRVGFTPRSVRGLVDGVSESDAGGFWLGLQVGGTWPAHFE